jgi:hypothetical protein
MPSPETQPLFDEAKRLGIGFYVGYAELAEEAGRTRRFNTAIHEACSPLAQARPGPAGCHRAVGQDALGDLADAVARDQGRRARGREVERWPAGGAGSRARRRSRR